MHAQWRVSVRQRHHHHVLQAARLDPDRGHAMQRGELLQHGLRRVGTQQQTQILLGSNHPVGDANKRNAYVALETFLLSNGTRVLASDVKMSS